MNPNFFSGRIDDFAATMMSKSGIFDVDPTSQAARLDMEPQSAHHKVQPPARPPITKGPLTPFKVV